MSVQTPESSAMRVIALMSDACILIDIVHTEHTVNDILAAEPVHSSSSKDKH